MGRHDVDEQAWSAAPPAAVWALLSDVRTWTDWGPWEEAYAQSERVRVLRRGRVRSVEEVTAFDPPFAMRYRLVSGGLPVTGYEAEVTLVGEGDGTRIRWRSSFDGRWPLVGHLVRWGLARFTRDAARRLADAAARGTMSP